MNIVKVMRDNHMKMSLWFLFRLSFLIIVIFSLLTTSAGAHNNKHKVIITTPLTHHHSYSSLTYNHSHTLTDRAHFDFLSSLARAAFHTNKTIDEYSSLYLGSSLTPLKSSGFQAHMEVGSQGLEQRLVMDTGSGLLWINCEPSYDIRVAPPLFNPASSTSSQIADCRVSAACLSPGGSVYFTCTYDDPVPRKNFCKFDTSYADGTTVSGRFYVENFKFENSTQVLNGVVFGCSRETNFFGANGILGLSQTSMSILKQKDYTKFSYCIGDVSDRSYPHNKLIVGDILNTTTTPAQTPIITEKDYRYYLNLEAIFIGGDKLDFDPAITRRNPDEYTGGMIVDSGSTNTFLPQLVYDKFEQEVVAELNYLGLGGHRNYSFTYGDSHTRVCYDGVFTTDLAWFPTVMFQFQGGAVMRFGTKSVFQQVAEDSFCLAVMPIEWVFQGSTLGILGNLMQQFTYSGFDLDRDIFAFQQDADCSLIG